MTDSRNSDNYPPDHADYPETWGDPVAEQWGEVRQMSRGLIDNELVEAAYADPVLRALFPLVSHGSLQFSRSAELPWSQDLPSIFPNRGGFRILRLFPHDTPEIGTAATPQEAVRMVRENIQED
ncbi:DUF6193 family natural product biosynthesis protein [Kitasatospora sp. NPDC059973]|uniref:DUF6193 family natural product biosynthesis protein n=1 Tax=Kitasatospora sp. NPDC059973 TaxID=3347020 RepID=UPI0036892AC2